MPFLTKLKVEEAPHAEWVLLEDLVYEGNTQEFVVPAGFITDLASIPSIFRPLFSVHGKHSKAAVVHDFHYITQTISKQDADGLFRRMMKELGVGQTRRLLMWIAVRIGGRYHKDIDLEKHGL